MKFFISISTLFVFLWGIGPTYSQLENNQEPVPKYCHTKMVQRPCRASYKRYTYDPETSKCAKFYFGGCSDSLNIFRTLAACKSTCERNITSSRLSTAPTPNWCSFDVPLKQECSNNIQKILEVLQNQEHYESKICTGIQEQSDCVEMGCCWIQERHLCYRNTESLAMSSCTILHNSNDFALGKIIFAAHKRIEEWTGHLHFNRSILGDFCIISDKLSHNDVDVHSTTFDQRRSFVLSSTDTIREGIANSIVIFFKGNYGSQKKDKFDKYCRSTSRPRYFL